jgi:hypothetical protein
MKLRNLVKIEKGLYLQLFLMLFILGIRNYIDFSLLREAILAYILIIFSKIRYVNKSKLKNWISWYLCIGILIEFMHIVGGYELVTALTEYRNFFLPFTLAFPASAVFINEQSRQNLLSIASLLLIILTIDVLLEWIMMLVGFSRDFIPWYQYQYLHLYRFNTSESPMVGAISPADAPVLGLMGFPNETSTTLTALLALNLPLLLSNKPIYIFNRCIRKASIKIVILFLSIIAIAILGIKTPMAALGIIIIIMIFKSSKKQIRKFGIFAILFVCFALCSYEYWSDSFNDLIEETAGGETSYIFNFKLFSAVWNHFLESTSFLFGDDFTNSSFYQFLEVRIINFTLALGVIWLICMSGIFITAIKRANRAFVNASLRRYDKELYLGIYFMLIVYIVDAFHYTNVMYSFNINIFAISLGLLMSSNNFKHE